MTQHAPDHPPAAPLQDGFIAQVEGVRVDTRHWIGGRRVALATADR